MDKEKNIRYVRGEHAPTEVELSSKSSEFFIGKYVKKFFSSSSAPVEHMWVKVHKVSDDGEYLIGIVSNDLVYNSRIKKGDKVAIHKDEIEGVRND